MIRIAFYLIFLYIALFCLIQFNLYYNLDYHDFDLAIYNQVIWNTLHGNFFFSSIRGGIYFKDHCPLILLIFIPIYAIFQTPLTLLFLQSLFLGLAGLPIFLLSRERLAMKFCICIVFLYLIYPATGHINLFEFHPESFSLFFLLFTFWFLIRDNFKLFIIFMLLSLMCKEDVSLVILMLGVYALLIKKSKKWIFIPLLCGAGWFVLSIFVIIPYFNKGEYLYTVFYSHLGNNFFEILKTVALHPILTIKSMFIGYKLKYLVQLFVPFSFLSFFTPSVLIVILPTFIRNLLSMYPPTSSITCQYTATLIPFILISALYGLNKILRFNIAKKYSNLLIILLLGIGLISSLMWGPQFYLAKNIYRYKFDYLDIVRTNFASAIPKDASVVATFDFLPRLSCRERLYTFHYVYFGREKLEKKAFVLPKDVDYALIDFGDYLTFSTFYTPQGGRNIRRFLKDGNWGIIKIINDIVLMKRNYASSSKLYEVIQHPLIQNKKEKNIAEGLALMGIDTDKIYIEEAPVLRFSLYWKSIKKITKDYSMIISISDKYNRVILQRVQHLCYNVYPTFDWAVGKIVKGNYWLALPLKNHLEEYRISIMLSDKNGELIPNSLFIL